jgi:leader peptidase (prepilin peptidase)/N-methyltransferase
LDNYVLMLPESFYIFIFFLYGALFGSFSNVIIYRCPKGLSVARPRSSCPNCKNFIRWYQNIPILSWIFLRGQCGFCSKKISFRYPVVELINALLFAGLYIKFGFCWLLLEYLIFVWALVVASFIDIDHMILPDKLTLSGIVIGLVGALLSPERELLPAILGVLTGGGFLWAVAYFYYVLRKEEGMGGGDIKLLAWIGAVLGWSSIPFTILVSSLIGTVGGLALLLKSKKDLKTVIPFGPYLSVAALIYIFWGQELAFWYFELFLPGLSQGF